MDSHGYWCTYAPDPMETAATMYSEYDYRGLSNIVEQMVDRIHAEAGKLMNLSDFVNFNRLYYDDVDSYHSETYYTFKNIRAVD